MSSVNVRIAGDTWVILKELSSKTNTSMQDIIQKAVEDYRRKKILEETNEAFLRLKSNTAAWQEEQKERAEWESTLGDNQ